MILDALARLALAPVLIAQAIKVRRRALVLPEAKGPRSGTLGAGPPLSLLIVGDSSAAGVGVTHQNAALAGQLTAALADHFTVTWQLRAKTSETTTSALVALTDMPAGPADVVVTALGVNDVTHVLPRRTWQRRQRTLRERLIAQTGARMIYVCGLPPMGRFPLLPQPLRWTLGRAAEQFERTMAAELSQEPRATHMPLHFDLDESHMAADGFHPGPSIYSAWGKELANRILSDWPKLSP